MILTKFNIQCWPMCAKHADLPCLRDARFIHWGIMRGFRDKYVYRNRIERNREDIAKRWTREAAGKRRPPRPFRVTRLNIRSFGWFTFTITHLCLDPSSYYSLLTHSSRSWIIYHLDTPLGTAHCCSHEIAASVQMRVGRLSKKSE